jgi:uncharacterized protein (DUF433 family)
MKPTLDAHIEQTPGVLGGKPRIAGHRIGVHHVAHWHLREGQSIDHISEQFGLSYAAIHAALAYYYDHREEIDARTAADDAFVEELRRNAPPSKLREKLSQHPRTNDGE